MIKKTFIVAFILSVFFVITPKAFAIGETGQCDPKNALPNHGCNTDLFCKPFLADATRGSCEKSTPVENVFGKIQAPDALKGFLQKDPTGALAISQFLSNLVILIYSLAGIVLIFMLLWGAFEWLTSGGDKEKLSSAQKKIINAIIGIVLLAIVFAIIQVLGTFTGFTFFKGQKP